MPGKVAPLIGANLIRVKDPVLRLGIITPQSKEATMPVDSILVSAAVVSMFVVFAGTLVWADLQTPPRQQPANRASKRRPF
jgi:hypothetical protein